MSALSPAHATRLYVDGRKGVDEMNLHCCAGPEHESREPIADQRRVRSSRFVRRLVRSCCCGVREPADGTRMTANISMSVFPTKRSLPATKNKAGFVSLTGSQSLLPSATSKRGRSPCGDPIHSFAADLGSVRALLRRNDGGELYRRDLCAVELATGAHGSGSHPGPKSRKYPITRYRRSDRRMAELCPDNHKERPRT